MVNKNSRFLKKALQALPRLSKNSLLKFCDNLIDEHYTLLTTVDKSPFAICIYKNSQVIYENIYFSNLLKTVPNIILFKDTGIHSIQDIYKKDRIFFITTTMTDELLIYYFIEQTEYFQENISNKTQESLAALENLAAGISHEIKNPLSAIDIHTQLLQYKIKTKQLSVSEEIQQYLHIVKTESNRLLSVLDTFLNMTRKSKPTLIFTETSHILETIKNLLGAELHQKNIVFHLNIDSVPKIFTSPSLLQQILLDLLRNSIEAVLNHKDKRIILSLKENNFKTHVLFIIEDSGDGIDSSLLYKIFDPYFTTKSNGTGLGLTLVKKMTEELGGEILVNKSDLGGAKFTLCFPISTEQKLLS